MKRDLPTQTKKMLWLTALALTATLQMVAQCPSGSVTNTSGTFGSGQKVCVTSNFNGNITLNSGATLTVINGGNFTGSLSINSGGKATVQKGGRLAPANFNNFADSLIAERESTVVLPNVNISNGAVIKNDGLLSFASGWNQNAPIAITNHSCGTLNFSGAMTVGNNATFTNLGRLNFLGALTVNSGTFINRGAMYVSGTLTSSGYFNNQNIMVFKSGGTLNADDSTVNTGFLVFSGALISNAGIRNEGLMHVTGSWTLNSSSGLLVNNTNAYVRVGGALMNNAVINGPGSFNVAGALSNNGQVRGRSITLRLRVNKNVTGTTSNLLVNTLMPLYDTTNYAAPLASPSLCADVLPVHLTGLQAAFDNGKVLLTWQDASMASQSYTIEFSADGKNFTDAGQVLAVNKELTSKYQFHHSATANGVLYYRIREVALNGRVQYSNTVIVRTNAAAITTNVFPNPFTDNLQVNVHLTAGNAVYVELFDAQGQVVRKEKRQGQAGLNVLNLTGLQSLLPGVYVARITSGTTMLYSKLIK